jgi:dihydroorotase-like cyclic amidohydrolase
MVLVNLWGHQVIKGKEMHSKGKYTPFEGVHLDVKVEDTFLRGQLHQEMKVPEGAFVLRFI